MATFDSTIEGIELRLTGLRLVKRRDGSVTVELPMIRDALGRSTPCIAFPNEIHAAIELAIIREVVETVRERSKTNHA